MQLNHNKDYGSAVSFWVDKLSYIYPGTRIVEPRFRSSFGKNRTKIYYKKLGLMMKLTHKFKWEIFYCWDTLMAQEKQ